MLHQSDEWKQDTDLALTGYAIMPYQDPADAVS
jgi:hypothetical protein